MLRRLAVLSVLSAVARLVTSSWLFDYMRHAGKNVQGYPDGARHKPTLSVPCVGTVPFAFATFDCSIDSDVVHTWTTEILLPELPACSVIVMDNASFHKRQDTLDALQAEGHTVLWLPPIARISTR